MCSCKTKGWVSPSTGGIGGFFIVDFPFCVVGFGNLLLGDCGCSDSCVGVVQEVGAVAVTFPVRGRAIVVVVVDAILVPEVGSYDSSGGL